MDLRLDQKVWKRSQAEIQTADFGLYRRPVKRIVVLKLDHFGDFIIGLPALRSLREAFPAAKIRLICGRWNESNAKRCGLVDEVRCFDFFPQRPNQENPPESDPLDVFDEAVSGLHDLAIDMRVDPDTRHLLARIDAKIRCGIGSKLRFPLLDIALPDEHPVRSTTDPRYIFLPPGEFSSDLPNKEPLHHEGPLVPGKLIHGSTSELPAGKVVAEVRLTVTGYLPGLSAASVQVAIYREGGQLVAQRVFGRRNMLKLRRQPILFEFENSGEAATFDFHVRVAGSPRSGTIRFSGVTVHRIEAATSPRFRPVELHVGEKLSLLVALIRARTTDLYDALMPKPGKAADNPRVARLPDRVRIAVAPFSNSSIRNWPPEYYAELVTLLLDQMACDITLIGTADQAPDADVLVEQVRSPRLSNQVGKTAWADLPDILRDNDLVICNNSGVAHLAASVGARVLAIYSGSHEPREWGPRGMHARSIMHPMPCSPCGFERLEECLHGHECMRALTPALVLAQAIAALAETESKRDVQEPARVAAANS